MATPGEIAEAIAYLASEDARFMHGTILSIDGGVSAS
jgi:NAD(P)-dependent dehydrogenase (short-subunit alcohol dehydrogenase family)